MKLFGYEIKKAKGKTPFPVPQWTPSGWVHNINNPQEILRDGYAVNAVVYSIIKTMSEKFGSIPWILYKVKDKKKASQYQAITSKGYNPNPTALLKTIVLKDSAFDEVSDHKILDLFNKPNEFQTGQLFREELLVFKKLVGAAGIYADTGFSELEPLELKIKSTVFIRLQPNRDLSGYDKVFYTITGQQDEIPKEQFGYWRYPNPNYTSTGNHIYGLPPLKAGASTVALDNDLVESSGYAYKYKGKAGAFTPKDETAMQSAAAQLDNVKKTVDEKTSGRSYEGLRPYLNLPMDYHEYGLTAVEAETIAQAGLNAERLCAIFNFPPYLVAMAKGTDNKYPEAVRYLITNTLYPDLTSFRDMMNDWLLGLFGKESEYYFDFDISALPELQEDFQKLVMSLKEMWWITPNERRLVTKYDTLADPLMDKILVPTNLQPLESVFDVAREIDPDIL